jgi:hypothetical protein
MLETMRFPLLLLGILFSVCVPSRAIVVRVTAPALQRTLERQLFNQTGPNGETGRHYLRGSAGKGCPVYADSPHVAFEGDRVVVSVKTHAKIGIGRSCFGIAVTLDSQVSFVPEAEGESVGFSDARIDKLSNNKELDLLLEPFLVKNLPQQMKVNAADLMRKLFVKAPDSTGYMLTLEMLDIHSMRIDGTDLVVDLDANFRLE